MHAALPRSGDGVGDGHPDATLDEFHAGGDHARRIARCHEIFVDAGNAGLRGAEQGTLPRRSARAKDHVGMLANEGSRLAGAPVRVGIGRAPGLTYRAPCSKPSRLARSIGPSGPYTPATTPVRVTIAASAPARKAAWSDRNVSTARFFTSGGMTIGSTSTKCVAGLARAISTTASVNRKLPAITRS